MSRPKPRYELWFDGATSGDNPRTGGCGVLYYKCESRGEALTAEEIYSMATRLSRRLGDAGCNGNVVPEYNGLILGLRGLLREHPICPFDVDIYGDSEVVIKQLKGEYEVRSPILKLYYEICVGLLSQLKGDYSLQHVPREENEIADELAQKAATMQPDGDDLLIFYPNIMHMYEMKPKIPGMRKLITGTDLGANGKGPSSECLVDATTVLELFGQEALHDLKDPGYCTIVKGKVEMTIVGILNRPIECFLDLDLSDDVQLSLTDVVVVDSLPYDAQISVRNPVIRRVLEEHYKRFKVTGGQHRSHAKLTFDSKNLEERFKVHSYWFSKHEFLSNF